jgi:hypothetical protein
LSSLDTDWTGTRAIFATTASISAGRWSRPPLGGQQLLRGAGLVDHVDRLVGQVEILEVLGRQRHGRLERRVGVADAVMLLVVRRSPLRMSSVSASVGSSTSIFWNRRDRPRSLSNDCLTSLNVVDRCTGERRWRAPA